MFDPTDSARVFATPPGADFVSSLIAGLDARLAGQPPEALARVEVHVSTARMARRLRGLYARRGASFLPRIRPIGALADRADLVGLPPAIPPLRLRLQLAQLIDALIAQQPDIAPRAAIHDLADSLADLMGEMHEERVTPAIIAALDVGDHSQHWARTQRFLEIVGAYFGGFDVPLTSKARQTRVVDHLAAAWRLTPPDHPVIVAGSTGSRGATARFMAAVAHLPQGAVILPGLDDAMPPAIWDRILDGRTRGLAGEDHPQYRLGAFARRVGLAPQDIPAWGGGDAPNPLRNRLMSLALRPAPVTDQWRVEGPALGDLTLALAGMTLLEAPTPQVEATAIALRLRQAAQEGQLAALISPDRTLTRQVTAALDRWGIVPDDSAGQPLSLSAPGRFLRHVAEAMTGPVSAEALLVLLKHPLCNSDDAARGPHLLRTRDLELQVLRGSGPFPTRVALTAWAARRMTDPGAMEWAAWVCDALIMADDAGAQPLSARVAAHLGLSELLAAGPTGAPARLWDGDDGAEAAALLRALTDEAEAGGAMTARDYADLLNTLLQDREARSPLRPHAGIMIWGALEARVQGADLLILAGLNEGTWPAAPSADPWLNRAMRDQAGLRLPDRQIGLSAHDFQQAVAAREVWLCRSRRDAETETVPSRWLNRLTNLLRGSGKSAAQGLDGMAARGQGWLDMAAALATPVDRIAPAPRPAPRPPVAARPRRISITDVERLIRDPYAVYAARVLRLRALDPLRPGPDAALRGEVLHDILNLFVAETADGLPPDARVRLMALADRVLAEGAPWPAARRLWRARLDRVADWFLDGEAARRSLATPWLRETMADWHLPDLDLTLRAKADRVDRLPDGRVAIYDYKTGAVPTAKQEAAFTKQLWLEAVMAENGAFTASGPVQAARIAYIGIGTSPQVLAHDPTPSDLARIAAEFRTLMVHFRDPATGFTARRAMEGVSYAGAFDHLARFGEWADTDAPVPQNVGRIDG